jgi:hypothetical protein
MEMLCQEKFQRKLFEGLVSCFVGRMKKYRERDPTSFIYADCISAFASLEAFAEAIFVFRTSGAQVTGNEGKAESASRGSRDKSWGCENPQPPFSLWLWGNTASPKSAPVEKNSLQSKLVQ